MNRVFESFRGRAELQKFGPRIQVIVRHPLLGRPTVISATQNRPVEALIDTGASRTVINPALAVSIGLLQVDTIKVAHVGGVSVAPVYAAALEFPSTGLEPVPALEVIASPLPSQPISCLIGRDVLQRWLLTYDGRTGLITIE